MAWKPANLETIVQAFVRHVDGKQLLEVLNDLPLKERHEVERQCVALHGKDAEETIRRAEAARKR
jgi:hypothetical protein